MFHCAIRSGQSNIANYLSTKQLTMINKIIVTAIILAFSFTAKSQFSIHAESAVSSFKQPSKIIFGAGIQYLFYYDYKFLPGINASVQFEMNRETKINEISVPIQLQARYYVVGRHACSGGGYTEVNAGGKIMLPLQKIEGAASTKSILPQASFGLGYRFPMSYDYNIKVGAILNNGKLEKFIGLKIGYTI